MLSRQSPTRSTLPAGAQPLILTHISRRYRERDVLAEARAVFPNTVVARDFDAFQVKRGDLTKFDLHPDES